MNNTITIGPCALYCGDCLEIMPGLECGHIITDPPYEKWIELIPSGHVRGLLIRGPVMLFWTPSWAAAQRPLQQ